MKQCTPDKAKRRPGAKKPSYKAPAVKSMKKKGKKY